MWRRLCPGAEFGAPLLSAFAEDRGDLQPVHQALGFLQQVQPPLACERAQGERPDHAVFAPGDEARPRGADDRPARLCGTGLVKVSKFKKILIDETPEQFFLFLSVPQTGSLL